MSNFVRRRRRLAKTVVYRLASVVVTIGVAYLFLGEVGAALDIGIAANLLKMGLYYVHERAWDVTVPPPAEA